MGNPIAFPEIYKAAFEDFVIPSYEVAPFTTIQNRAMVTRSLKAIAGVERIMCRGINQLQNEFGPNGERVFEADNKDARIRFIGSGWNAISNSSGTAIQSQVVNDSAEITFYGTGLNFLGGNAGSGFDYRATIDGGAEGANIFVTKSPILYGRNYNANDVIPIASGLTLGWHTVKLRNVLSNSVFTFGFEILNQRTDLAVYSGQGISNGSTQGLSALTTSAFNAGVSGTRGGRVVKYIQNGIISQAVTEVDATSKYLTLTDHTNEEVVRRINYREFGANRADDFSTLVNGAAVSNRAFTLDDGTTTLVMSQGGSYVVNGIEGLGWGAAGTFFTLTFVGTGLDITEGTASLTGSNVVITLDGVSLGNAPQLVGTKRRTICSGLPYGTHTVKFANGSPVATDWNVSDFIIYQSKKPSIPAGALEVADYNLPASFTQGSAVGFENRNTGTLQKSPLREFIYVGSWSIASLNPAIAPGGFDMRPTLNTDYFEYTFVGTGFDFQVRANSGSANIQFSLNGSSNFTGLTVNKTASGTFTIGTGTYTGAINDGHIGVSGLAFGKYTLRVSYLNAATVIYFNPGIDVITPIHINEKSLKVGNQSLNSVTKYSPEKNVANAGPDLSKAKAWVVYDMVNNTILSSNNISAVLKTATGRIKIFFEKPFKTKNYSALGQVGRKSGNGERVISEENTNGERTNNSIGFGVIVASTLALSDVDYVNLVFFGELIDE